MMLSGFLRPGTIKALCPDAFYNAQKSNRNTARFSAMTEKVSSSEASRRAESLQMPGICEGTHFYPDVFTIPRQCGRAFFCALFHLKKQEKAIIRHRSGRCPFRCPHPANPLSGSICRPRHYPMKKDIAQQLSGYYRIDISHYWLPSMQRCNSEANNP